MMGCCFGLTRVCSQFSMLTVRSSKLVEKCCGKLIQSALFFSFAGVQSDSLMDLWRQCRIEDDVNA